MEYLIGDQQFDQEMERHVLKLPQSLQSMIKSDIPDVFIGEIGDRLGLSEDDRDAIGHELLLVLIQATPVENYLENLITEALLPPEVARVVFEETNQRFLIPLKDMLRTDLQQEQKKPVASTNFQTTSTPSTPVIAPSTPPQQQAPKDEHMVVAEHSPTYNVLLETPRYTADEPPKAEDLGTPLNTPPQHVYTPPIGKPLPRQGLPPLHPPTPPQR